MAATLTVTDWWYVRGGTHAATPQPDPGGYVPIKSDAGADNDREGVMRLAVTADGPITAASVTVTCGQSQATAVTFNVYEAAAGWSTGTVTWNNAPATGGPVDSFTISGVGDTGPRTVDVTALAEAARQTVAPGATAYFAVRIVSQVETTGVHAFGNLAGANGVAAPTTSITEAAVPAIGVLRVVGGASNDESRAAAGSPALDAAGTLYEIGGNSYTGPLKVASDPVGGATNGSSHAAFTNRYRALLSGSGRPPTAVAVCEVAVPGTPIASGIPGESKVWDGTGAGSDDLVGAACDLVDDALDALRADGHTPTVVFTISAGGRDAIAIRDGDLTQSAYGAALDAFLDVVAARAASGGASGPWGSFVVVLVQPHTISSWGQPGADAVAAVAAENRRAAAERAYVEVGVPEADAAQYEARGWLNGDLIHYGIDAQNNRGVYDAEALFAWAYPAPTVGVPGLRLGRRGRRRRVLTLG